MKKKDCAIYDFDGTLYDGDSFIDFFLFTISKNPLFLFTLILLPFYVFAWKIKFINDQFLKEKFLSFLKGRTFKERERLVESFWQEKKSKIFPWVYNELKKDLDEGKLLICISASPDFLLNKIAAQLNFNVLLSSNFCNDQGILNKMISPNCKGEEKVLRLNAWEEENKVNLIVKKMVSDSFVDMPLFKIAEECYLVKNKKMSFLEV